MSTKWSKIVQCFALHVLCFPLEFWAFSRLTNEVLDRICFGIGCNGRSITAVSRDSHTLPPHLPGGVKVPAIAVEGAAVEAARGTAVEALGAACQTEEWAAAATAAGTAA
jgi:hypothetical protein